MRPMHVNWNIRHAALLGLALLSLVFPVSVARAAEPRTIVKSGSYDDVHFELNNAIIVRGLNISGVGNLNAMLERTGADVGSTTEIYKSAEYISFCSAKLSRRMMEADARNIAFCPFILFIYETVAKPGEVVVGYRIPEGRGDSGSRAALADAEKMLESIIQDATK